MVLIPLVAGIVVTTRGTTIEASDVVVLITLSLAWVTGFFFFHAAGRYLSTRLRPRYRRAVFTYAAISAALTATTIALKPLLLAWALVFLPLMTVALLCAWRGYERSLTARIATITAAAMIVPVCASTRCEALTCFVSDLRPWIVTALLGAYFATTVPYVKTLIRHRDSTTWLVGSIVAHVVVFVGVAALATFAIISPWHIVVWTVVLVRAVAFPISQQQRGRRWSPRVIGLTEMVLSFLVFITALR